MALLDWNPNLSVDVPEMDEEHKKLIALINDLNEAMKAGKATERLQDIFGELVAYAQTHFASEERYLAEIGYPHLDEQRAEHAALIRQVFQFKADFNAGQAMISIKLMEFLRDWVNNHLQKSDKKYGIWASYHIGA